MIVLACSPSRRAALLLSVLAGLLLSGPVAASRFAGEQAADLPPLARVAATLGALPEVRAARQLQAMEHANRDRLAAGSQEWQVRTSVTRRQVNALTAADQAGHFNEWEVAVERPWRSAAKAAVDVRQGEAGIRYAENLVGDTTHEAARGLLRRWFDWQRTLAEREVLARQQESWTQVVTSVRRRVQAGDAAHLDQELAEAALAQAEARLAEREGQLVRVAAEFGHAYPELAGCVPVTTSEPQADPQSLEETFTQLFAENHELAMAQAELDRRLALAERARADQQPDTTIGVRLASERGGAEHLAGLVVTIPLGGANRSASLAMALAEAEAARAGVERVRRRLEGDIAGQYAGVQGQYAAWRHAREAAARLDAVAGRLGKAYALGEVGLADWLAAGRQQQDARLAAAVTSSNASEAFYRLRLDTHALWPMDADETDGGR